MKLSFVLIFCCLTIGPVLGAEGNLSPQTILEKADKRFYPAQGTWSMNLKTTNLDQKVLEFRIDFSIKGEQNQTAVYNYPALLKGTVAMKINNTIYFKDNRWPKPQILSYQAVFVDSSFSYGDVLAVNLASDYAVESSGDTVDQGKDCYLLTLKPRHKELYARIEVAVEKDNFNTLHRTYYTASGEKEKESTFSAFQEANGRVVAFKVEMKNLLLDLDSSAEVTGLKEEKVPDFLFDPQNIGRIHAK